MKNGKRVISFYLLVLFFFSKIAGLHVVSSHEEDTKFQHCELCQITSTVNFMPLFSNGFVEFSPSVLDEKVGKTEIGTSQDSILNKEVCNYFVTRPPPFLV